MPRLWVGEEKEKELSSDNQQIAQFCNRFQYINEIILTQTIPYIIRRWKSQVVEPKERETPKTKRVQPKYFSSNSLRTAAEDARFFGDGYERDSFSSTSWHRCRGSAKMSNKWGMEEENNRRWTSEGEIIKKRVSRHSIAMMLRWWWWWWSRSVELFNLSLFG